MKFITSILGLALLAVSAQAQCSAGNCLIQSSPVYVQQAAFVQAAPVVYQQAVQFAVQPVYVQQAVQFAAVQYAPVVQSNLVYSQAVVARSAYSVGVSNQVIVANGIRARGVVVQNAAFAPRQQTIIQRNGLFGSRTTIINR